MEEKIRQVVHPADVEAVMQTQLPLIAMEDILRWPCTSDGRITVRSSYHAIKNASSSDLNADQVTTITSSKLWPAFWRAKVWTKVQVFMWRLATNSVGVKGNLLRRGIPINPICHACQCFESREHAFLQCNQVQCIWHGLFGLNFAGRAQEPLERWLEDAASLQPSQNVPTHSHQQHNIWLMVMIACWYIWKARCKLVFEEKVPIPTFIVYQIKGHSTS